MNTKGCCSRAPLHKSYIRCLLKVHCMTKLMGIGLILIGVYFLGQNIVFTSRPSPYWYTNLAADACVITMLSGMLITFFAGSTFRPVGWFLIATGIALVFISGYVVLEPTTLWEFFISFMCIAGGYKLMTTGRISI